MTKCPKQYFIYNATTDKCSPCPKGCRLCSSPTMCIACDIDFILNYDG